MTTNERIKEINRYFTSHPELKETKAVCEGPVSIQKYGAFSTPIVKIHGYVFDEYDNGRCYSRFPWVHYYRITTPKGQELRCEDYGTWVRRLHRFMIKRGLIKKHIFNYL